MHVPQELAPVAQLSVDSCSRMSSVIRAARFGWRGPVARVEAPSTLRWPQLGRQADLAARPEHDPAWAIFMATFLFRRANSKTRELLPCSNSGFYYRMISLYLG